MAVCSSQSYAQPVGLRWLPEQSGRSALKVGRGRFAGSLVNRRATRTLRLGRTLTHSLCVRRLRVKMSAVTRSSRGAHRTGVGDLRSTCPFSARSKHGYRSALGKRRAIRLGALGLRRRLPAIAWVFCMLARPSRITSPATSATRSRLEELAGERPKI